MRSLILQRREMFLLLAGLSLAVAGAYIYFVQASVYNTVTALEWSKKVGALTSGLGELEGEFYTLSQTVNQTAAEKGGFVGARETTFVKVGGSVTGVSLESSGQRAR